MPVVMARLVPNIGDPKITVRRAVIQTLHVYMQHTRNLNQIFKFFITHGLENHQAHIRKEAVVALPMLFTPEFAQEDFYEITTALAKKLSDTSSDQALAQHTLLSMDKIKGLIGEKQFESYVQRFPPTLRKYYHRFTSMDSQQHYTVNSTPHHTYRDTGSDFKNSESVAFVSSDSMPPENGHTSYHPHHQAHPTHMRVSYEFGVIPSQIIAKLQDQSNFRVRSQAVEELRYFLKDMSDATAHAMSPHVPNFINFLRTLLDDSNFRITTMTLEMIEILVIKQAQLIKPHVKTLVETLTKPMSDTKTVIRQAIMRVFIRLMQILSPKDVLSVIGQNLSHRNSRVRQETLNAIIASLLKFPSYDFDLSDLCQRIAHTLVDNKRQVRQAALECFAVIASNLGAGKMQPLVTAVDAVELSTDGDGLMAAVQARLARRLLPKLSDDFLVEYATPIPSSAGSRSATVNLPPGADIEWILSASGSVGGSARSNRSDLELESVVSSAASSARSTPAPPTGGESSTNYGPTPRRFSAGRAKGKLPWDDFGTSDEYESEYPTVSSTHIILLVFML